MLVPDEGPVFRAGASLETLKPMTGKAPSGREGKLLLASYGSIILALRHISGSLAYTAEIEWLAAGPAVLDLGEVREIADISVHGEPAGVRLACAGECRLS